MEHIFSNNSSLYPGTKSCIAWRQTGSCDPNGNREPKNDKHCDEIVWVRHSGFCECSGGIKAMEKRCSWRPGRYETCNQACSGS